MANYPKELTDLLQQYMTDGIMTEKERAVLLRKAETMDVDKDEFDLYIDAEVQKFDQKIDSAKRQAKGNTCPHCGGVVQMFENECPHCNGSINPQATKELNEIIENLEEALLKIKNSDEFSSTKAVAERYIRKAELYYGNNPKIIKLLSVIKEEIKAEEEINELNEITSFLEDALVDLKTAENYERSKANVEKYIHKAEVYYENNHKIQELLIKVKAEKKKAEDRYNREKKWRTIKSIFIFIGKAIKFTWNLMTNIIFWCFVAALVGVYFYFFDDEDIAYVIWAIDALILILSFMLYFVNKEDREKREHERELARINRGLTDKDKK